jgi:hypothetical protein
MGSIEGSKNTGVMQSIMTTVFCDSVDVSVAMLGGYLMIPFFGRLSEWPTWVANLLRNQVFAEPAVPQASSTHALSAFLNSSSPIEAGVYPQRSHTQLFSVLSVSSKLNEKRYNFVARCRNSLSNGLADCEQSSKTVINGDLSL